MTKSQNLQLDQAHDFGCDIIQSAQDYLIQKYATKGITLEPMSNDEFEMEYAEILNTSERRLIAELSKFWEIEVEHNSQS